MDNRIRRIEVIDYSLDPVTAEVWISVHPEHHAATTEVRGRLMGPRCLYSNTVEVAYPLRPMSSHHEQCGPSGLTVRAPIPEACLWEPQCPFLYQGPVELWQEGQLADRVSLSHGLRSLKRNEHGLLVNGRPLTLHGRRIGVCSDLEAAKLRQSGYNLVIAPVAANSLSVWEQADRFGFLVLGQLGECAEETRLMESLRGHASCLGWLSAEQSALSAEQAIACYLAHGNPEAM
ncbi:MAG TPA: hypothetical protein VH592_17495 [Gemmataceae bacterium]|jgi:hypothetical protein